MSEEYATTRQDFLAATASYLGLNPDNVGADSNILFSEAQGDLMTAVIHVYLKPSDIIGIGKRMQEIAKEQGDIVQVHLPEPVMGENDTTAAMRIEYNALSQADKGKHGSFGKYVTWRMMNDKPRVGIEHADIQSTDVYGKTEIKRQVTHVDAPEEPEPTNMDAVWVNDEDCLPAQRQFASDSDWILKRHLIQWAMLTDEQKQKAQEAKP